MAKPHRLLTCVFNEEANVEKTATQMMDVEKTGKITQEAINIVDKIFLPDNVCNVWSTMESSRYLAEATDFFKNINFIGYSYGTSLIQQIETYVSEKLASHNLSLEPLKSVKAINIGPVASPIIVDENGTRYKANSKNLEGCDGLFEQIFLFKATDKVMSDVIKDRLVPKDSENAYEVYGTDCLTFICEKTGSEMLMRFGVGKFASGFPAPQIKYDFDHEAHDFRIYTNTLTSTKDDGIIFCNYPSSNLGVVLRQAASLIFSDDKFSQMSLLSNLKKQDYGDQLYDLKKIEEEFLQIIHGYRQIGIEESISYLQEKAEAHL